MSHKTNLKISNEIDIHCSNRNLFTLNNSSSCFGYVYAGYIRKIIIKSQMVSEDVGGSVLQPKS